MCPYKVRKNHFNEKPGYYRLLLWMVTMYSRIISRCIAWWTRVMHANAVRLLCILNTFGMLKTEAANWHLYSKCTAHIRSGKYCSWWTRLLQVTAVICYHVFLPLVVCQKRKPQIDGGFLRCTLLMENQVTKDNESEWFLCKIRYFLIVLYVLSQTKKIYRKRCLWATTIDVTIYSNFLLPTTSVMPKTEATNWRLIPKCTAHI